MVLSKLLCSVLGCLQRSKMILQKIKALFTRSSMPLQLDFEHHARHQGFAQKVSGRARSTAVPHTFTRLQNLSRMCVPESVAIIFAAWVVNVLKHGRLGVKGSHNQNVSGAATELRRAAKPSHRHGCCCRLRSSSSLRWWLCLWRSRGWW